MGEKTAIEWTDHTFNPWWGCEKISPGCANCYAADIAARFGTEWGPKAERRFFGDQHWNEPVKWNKAAEKAGVRRRVFCASMADVFEDRRDLDEHRARLWTLIEATSHLDWLLLTKRPESVDKLAPSLWLPGIRTGTGGAWPANVWIGTTVEDQEQAEKRIPELLNVPARVRFLSCEPLLGPVVLADACNDWLNDEPGISWVICGGESGSKARPMHPEWARSLRDQCVAAGVPYFFKQWGEWWPRHDLEPAFDGKREHQRLVSNLGSHVRVVNLEGGHGFHGEGAIYMQSVGKKAAGSLLDGVEHKAFPVVTL